MGRSLQALLLIYWHMKNRRKYHRFRIRGGALADVRSSQITVGPIVDIGMGGLAFHYLDSGAPLDEGTQLNIWSNERLIISDIPFRVCSNQKTHRPMTDPRNGVKRCSVCFHDMDAPRTSQLQSFIARSGSRL